MTVMAGKRRPQWLCSVLPVLLANVVEGFASTSFVFLSKDALRRREYGSERIRMVARQQRNNVVRSEHKQVQVGDLLSDLPTPTLLLELSLAEKYVKEAQAHEPELTTLDDFLNNPQRTNSSSRPEESSSTAFADCGALFIHTTVTSTEQRDAVVKEQGSGKSHSICDVDTPFDAVQPHGGCYLGLGLANHHVIGYYWARSMGIGASLPAHGISFGPPSSSSGGDPWQTGELYWKKRGPGLDPSETTEESSNSNDGKRSEWADFLKEGDTVQLVPNDPLSMITLPGKQRDKEEHHLFDEIIGIRRIGRPLGADPIVEKIWKRTQNADEEVVWLPQS